MSKPNILLITTDQQRFDTIHALGNPHIYTPHLNWLVDEGVTFGRCYSDCPICMPARATIMTGKHGYTHGLTNNDNRIKPMDARATLPGVLTRNGYQTRAQGKMHFEPMRANYGFEHMELPMDYYRYMNENREMGVPKGHGVGENEIEPVISTVDETKSAIYWTVKRSIDFIETRDDTRPFFLWTSFAKPHPPFDPSYNYWALYQNMQLPAPVTGDWSGGAGKAPLGFYEPTYMLNNAYRMSADQLMNVKRAYYACITQIDYSLGLLFARMREMGLFDNTWIIFTSDHGDLMGDHNMCAKSIFLEGSAHIPMIIRPPNMLCATDGQRVTDGQSAPGALGALRGRRCGALVTLADLAPTILTAAGLGDANKAVMDGVDLLKIAAGGGKDRAFYGNCNDTFFAVMEDGYKYQWTGIGGDELLFYLPDDPMEQRDLSKTSPKIAARMKKKLDVQVGGYNAGLLIDGALTSKDRINGPADVNKWPGFHSTTAPSDVLH